MTIRLWRPLHARMAGRSLISITSENPTESLERQLRTWIEEFISDEDAARIAVRLDIPEAFDDNSALYDESFIHADDLYEVIDAMLDLRLPEDPYFGIQRRCLQQYLDDSLSIYTISRDGCGLEKRADPIAAAALSESITSANSRINSGSANEHLMAAWALAHAMSPDAPRSYSESIKAVESAAHAVIEPTNSKATLGTMTRYIRTHSSEFCLMLPGPGVSISAVLEMMSTLWKGQTSRHGSQSPTRSETLEEARAAVQLAVTLVQWFSSEMVQRITITTPSQAADQITTGEAPA